MRHTGAAEQVVHCARWILLGYGCRMLLLGWTCWAFKLVGFATRFTVLYVQLRYSEVAGCVGSVMLWLMN